jgi:hypothetical protein
MGEERWTEWRQQGQSQRTEERSERYGWLVVGFCAFGGVVVVFLSEKRQWRPCHRGVWPGDCRMMVVRFLFGGGVVFGSGGEWCCGAFAVAAVVVSVCADADVGIGGTAEKLVVAGCGVDGMMLVAATVLAKEGRTKK